ncbi:MAG: alpha/beta hydrolase [Hyphomicrobiales bacterium]|nr:MAG: alpha/beta hydrolase [Hyphomicrobiales bacterium]
MEIARRYQFDDETGPLSLAARQAKGSKRDPSSFVWLGGFRSDMMGTKAQAMVDEAAHIGVDSLRFDYSGHGESEGKFIDGTISKWVAQSLQIIREASEGPQILVGSSMGGWIALRICQELEKLGEDDRLAGLLLIAPAADFTSLLMEPEFNNAQREAIETNGFIAQQSEYSDEPNIITKKLLDDGRGNSVLNGQLRLGIPVRILQGMKDPDVPYEHAMKLVHELMHDDVTITLVKNGDHRLSREQDIELLRRTMQEMAVRNI